MTFTHINLLLIPINAYFVGTDSSTNSKILNAVAVLVNLMIVAVRLAS